LKRARRAAAQVPRSRLSALQRRFGRDHAEAALLEDAARRNVVRRDALERPRPINGQERIERIGRDPFAPVGAADPVRHLALAGGAPGPDRSDDFVADDDDLVDLKVREMVA
jgi:hypothetical protein